MHVNIHAHIFTLQSVLSREAVRVMAQRLEDYGAPAFIVAAVTRLLERLLDRPELLDERELLARLLTELKGVSGFDRFVEENLSRLPFAVVIRGDGLEELQLATLRQALDELSTAMADPDDVAMRPFDIVETLRLAMRSTITEVADVLLEQMEPDDALVALMMDIRAADEPERDRANFLRQLRGTREAALQRPGRVLPFFAVHPDRPEHFELMEEALEGGAFVGVKLYPSLGYAVDGPELMKVYDYCIDRDVPVLLHCSHGGFYRRKEFVDYCDPAHWKPVIEGELAGLRVCFAHFGGWQSLGRPDGLDEGTWGRTILDLMRDCPQVYTDLSFHTDQMHDPEDEAHYFQTLAGLLRDDHLRYRILFGTDSWLLRMEMTEAVFWRYYRERMTPEDFARIASRAPRAFLGFPEREGDPPRPNLQRHLDFLVDHRSRVGRAPATWVTELTDETFDALREPADWHRKARPVRCTYALAREYMTGAQRNGGYSVARTLRLDELRYFRPGDPNFSGPICRGLALHLVGCCEDGGAGYVPGWSRGDAVTRLQEVFRKGDKRLVDLAALLDTIFDFPEGLA
jgi:predicted TIM-barrel fold metal-dependent hydrolase